MLSNQPDLVAKLSGASTCAPCAVPPLNQMYLAIEIRGLKERHFDLSADTFVTVSVDGEQQIQTQVIENDLNPKWRFTTPYTLCVLTKLLVRSRRS